MLRLFGFARQLAQRPFPLPLQLRDKEMEAGQVAVRTRKGEDLGSMSIKSLIDRLNQEVQTKV